ncbi:MAG TPA: hypothetical protein VLK82_13670, partial [Candidatus Tectomicrobia bacterium]|nr:hypothetical protein [Candidatus Tectomicrobia bacterium]
RGCQSWVLSGDPRLFSHGVVRPLVQARHVGWRPARNRDASPTLPGRVGKVSVVVGRCHAGVRMVGGQWAL